MKILIAGLGSIGRRHLRNLLSLGEHEILLYRTHQSTLPDEELADFPVETDLMNALAQKPDAVIVSNPTALHLDIALPALKAGCHLLLEKPVADQMDKRVVELQKAAEETGSQVLVGFQFRFHPVLAEIRQIIASGRIGRPLTVRVHWGEYLPGWHPWEDYREGYAARKDLGGGVVNTLCHPFDYLRWLIGEVRTVSAKTAQVSNLDLQVEDLAEIILTFENACVGSVHLDYFQRPPAHWLEMISTNGYLRWENETGIARVYEVSGDRWETLSPPADFTRNEIFLAEMRHFLALVRGEVEPRCSLLDGIRALEITKAVHTSSSLGQTLEV